jgi:hypothetical protein
MQDLIETQLKQQLEQAGSIKLLYIGKIIEGYRSQDRSFITQRFLKSPLDDEDQDSKGFGKLRIVCISLKKKKAKLLKMKYLGPNQFTDSPKKLEIEDIKSLEMMNETEVQLNCGKLFFWNFESSKKKLEFLYCLINVSDKYVKKAPRLVNFDYEMLKGMFLLRDSMDTQPEVVLKQELEMADQDDDDDEQQDQGISHDGTFILIPSQ